MSFKFLEYLKIPRTTCHKFNNVTYMNIARIHCFWNSFVKNNLWKKKKKKKEKKSTNSRGLKIRSEDWRGGKRRDTREMPAHDRPYSPVKGLITIVKPVRRSARVGEQMRALNRRYLGTAIMCRVRLQDTRSYFLSRTHAHPPPVTNGSRRHRRRRRHRR